MEEHKFTSHPGESEGKMGGAHCMCGSTWVCTHKFLILRWILGIVILGVVFSLGVTVGKFAGRFEDGRFGQNRYSGNWGYERMMGGRRQGENFAYPQMMQGRTFTAPQNVQQQVEPIVPSQN